MPPRPLPCAPRRILLIHFGQMGDAVMALPAAQALRANYPAASLTVLAGRSGAEIFRLAGFAPVWSVDRRAWRAAPARAAAELPVLLARLRRERFELSVDLHTYKETNLLAWAAGIPARVAMLRPTRSWPWLITHRPPQDEPAEHLLRRYCRVLEPLGIAVNDRQPRLAPPSEARAWAEEALPPESRWLGICPGAGHPSRRWPPERFAAAVAAWSQVRGRRPAVAIFAGPEESEAELAPLLQLRQARVFTRLPLARLAAALARCHLVLTNASGPSHIAAAAGAAVVTVGEVPRFDPVGRITPVRAPRRVAEVPVAAVVAALEAAWAAVDE
ncbi:MAG: glycosyltransferase family 9 protein [Terriglobales bacterium]